jgi:hypothetical protein
MTPKAKTSSDDVFDLLQRRTTGDLRAWTKTHRARIVQAIRAARTRHAKPVDGFPAPAVDTPVLVRTHAALVPGRIVRVFPRPTAKPFPFWRALVEIPGGHAEIASWADSWRWADADRADAEEAAAVVFLGERRGDETSVSRAREKGMLS